MRKRVFDQIIHKPVQAQLNVLTVREMVLYINSHEIKTQDIFSLAISLQ